MRTLKIALLVAILGILAGGLSAAEKSAKGTQPVYTIHTMNDTIWVGFGNLRQPVLLSKIHSPDSTHLTFEYSLMLWSGKDTVTIEPTTEAVQVWMTSPKDTVYEVVIFRTEQERMAPDTVRLSRLHNYQTFNTAKPPDSIVFTFTSPRDSELTSLRTRYNLDSVAGTGDDFARATNLLHWVHRRLRHDGTVNLPNPDPFTTTHILEVAATENRTFHCGILANTMNDVFLASGFKSRTVVCMPYDTADHECHQVTMLWSNQFHKWILMDPTNDAWFTDTAGVPLSPFEVRQAMANGDSLRLPDGINHNGDALSKQAHCNYMAKNLFLLKGWAYRNGGGTAGGTGVEVYFEPAGYLNHVLGVVESPKDSRYPVYHTDNADWFFAPPQ